MWPPENINPDAKSHEIVMANAIIVVLIDIEKVERKSLYFFTYQSINFYNITSEIQYY